MEVRTILKHVIARIRRHWPKPGILVRGDSYYGRSEAMDWCDANGIDYIFGFGGNPVLHDMVRPFADELCVRRAITGAEKRRIWKGLRYGAKSWGTQRRMVARIEATTLGLDIRYIVTSLPGPVKHLYETVYCGRGQAENFIHHELYVKCREAVSREASPTAAVIDSQSVKSAEKGGLD